MAASCQVFTAERLLANAVRCASSFSERLIGLLRTESLVDGEGLWIRPGASVHTLGMQFPIDVVFLDADQSVVGLSPWVRPGRVRVAPRTTYSTLELWAGAIESRELALGTRLRFRVLADEN